MSQKRHPEDGTHRAPRSEGSTSPDDKRRKIPNFKKVVMDAVTMHQLQRFLEPLIRRVVKEEVESALKKHLTDMNQNCAKETKASETRSLKLRFLSNLSLPVFTGARIEGEEVTSIQVALVDCSTGKIIETGHESLAKVEIVVLEGDFDSEESDNWTFQEFKNNVVREREGKKPLLTGDPILYLKNGVGCLGEISFTDNSSWTRSRRFRLGVRVLDTFDGTRIKEAKTESFIVRDHRGELYKKHHPPSLSDEVWRLEKIGKDGAFHKRLSQEHVYTVKDFLTLLFVDSPRLRNILGPGMSTKMWEITVDHARKCVLEKGMCVYCLPDSQYKTGVVFNIVGQVMGVLAEGEYVPADKLSETDRVDANNMVSLASEHWEDVVAVEDEASLSSSVGGAWSQLPNAPSFLSASLSGFSVPQTVNIGFEFPQSTASSPDIMSSFYSSLAGTSGIEEDEDDFPMMDLRYDHDSAMMSFPSQAVEGSVGPLICEDPHLQFLSGDDLPGHGFGFGFGSPRDHHHHHGNEELLWPAVGARDVKVVRAARRWKMLASVLKWFFIMVNKKRSHVEKIKQILAHGV